MGGRERSIQNAARTIDLDLISYGEIFLDTVELTLPHPRAHLRAFVLEPWASIDVDGVLPGHGEIKSCWLPCINWVDFSHCPVPRKDWSLK